MNDKAFKLAVDLLQEAISGQIYETRSIVYSGVDRFKRLGEKRRVSFLRVYAEDGTGFAVEVYPILSEEEQEDPEDGTVAGADVVVGGGKEV